MADPQDRKKATTSASAPADGVEKFPDLDDVPRQGPNRSATDPTDTRRAGGSDHGESSNYRYRSSVDSTNSSSQQAAAERARASTADWRPPPYNRRQSWTMEDHKHAMHMTTVADLAPGKGRGFSERVG